jgi:hypothetical protein
MQKKELLHLADKIFIEQKTPGLRPGFFLLRFSIANIKLTFGH